MKECSINLTDVTLPATQFGSKKGSKGFIISAHGRTKKERDLALKLQDAGYTVLLYDLLTEEEGGMRDLHRSIPYQTKRLLDVRHTLNLDIPVAYLGAAAELDAAAKEPDLVQALIIPRGCPEHAHHLSEVHTPTLFLVDKEQPYRCLTCEKKMLSIRNTSDQVAKATINWLENYF